MNAITRKYNRMVVEAKLKKRAEKNEEAKQEAATVILMHIINDNAFLAGRYAMKLQEENARRAKRTAKRNKITALEHEGNLWLAGVFGSVAVVAIAAIAFVCEMLTLSGVMASCVLAVLAMAVCIGGLYRQAGKIAATMEGEGGV